MTDTIESLTTLAKELSVANPQTLALSHECYQRACDYLNTSKEEITPKLPNFHELWLCGQWKASFDSLPRIATHSTHAGIVLMQHLQGIAYTMKALNFPFWHLFIELSTMMHDQTIHIVEIDNKLQDLLEKSGNESMH